METIVDAQKLTVTRRQRLEDTWKTTEKEGEICSRRLQLVRFKVKLHPNVMIVWEKGMTVFSVVSLNSLLLDFQLWSRGILLH